MESKNIRYKKNKSGNGVKEKENPEVKQTYLSLFFITRIFK